jgi:hypothetical protein
MINGPFRSRDVSYVRNRKGPFTAFCVFIWQSSVDWYELAVTRQLQGCQMVYLRTENINFYIFLRAFENFGIFYGHLSICWMLWLFMDLVVIWCIFFRFGMLCKRKTLANPDNCGPSYIQNGKVVEINEFHHHRYRYYSNFLFTIQSLRFFFISIGSSLEIGLDQLVRNNFFGDVTSRRRRLCAALDEN